MNLYCPRCSSQAVEGQRYCRQCGTNLGIILDAMDGKTVSLDFETLKKDLRQLGQSLRTSFEEASREVKKTRRQRRHQQKNDFGWVDDVAQTAASAATEAVAATTTAAPARPLSTKPIPIKVKQVRGGNSRQHSFQQAALSIFGGGALTWALYYLLQTAGRSGLLWNLEQLILRESQVPLYGLAPVFQALWVLGLIPVAKGVAHLINGTFLAAKPTENPTDAVIQELNARLATARAQPIQQSYSVPVSATAENPPGALDTSGFKRDSRQPEYSPVGSITEDPTERFDSREPDLKKGS
jgi:hypothetical protein